MKLHLITMPVERVAWALSRLKALLATAAGVGALYVDGTRPLLVDPLIDAYHVLEAPGRAETPD